MVTQEVSFWQPADVAGFPACFAKRWRCGLKLFYNERSRKDDTGERLSASVLPLEALKMYWRAIGETNTAQWSLSSSNLWWNPLKNCSILQFFKQFQIRIGIWVIDCHAPLSTSVTGDVCTYINLPEALHFTLKKTLPFRHKKLDKAGRQCLFFEKSLYIRKRQLRVYRICICSYMHPFRNVYLSISERTAWRFHEQFLSRDLLLRPYRDICNAMALQVMVIPTFEVRRLMSTPFQLAEVQDSATAPDLVSRTADWLHNSTKGKKFTDQLNSAELKYIWINMERNRNTK